MQRWVWSATYKFSEQMGNRLVVLIDPMIRYPTSNSTIFNQRGTPQSTDSINLFLHTLPSLLNLTIMFISIQPSAIFLKPYYSIKVRKQFQPPKLFTLYCNEVYGSSCLFPSLNLFPHIAVPVDAATQMKQYCSHQTLIQTSRAIIN